MNCKSTLRLKRSQKPVYNLFMSSPNRNKISGKATDGWIALTEILRSQGLHILISAAFLVGLPLIFFWLADEVFEGDLHSFDESVRNFFHSFATPQLTVLARLFSFLGSPLFLAIFGGGIVCFLLLKKRKALAGLFAITMAGEILMSQLLKAWFERIRPEAFFGYALPVSYSFPSGHAFGSFCFYGILAWLIVTELEMRFSTKIIIVAFTLLLIFSIGLSRIYLGVHYPSDVLAGFAAGLSWIGIVIDQVRRARLRKNNRKGKKEAV